MPHHEVKKCPRCNRAFECKAGTITQCDCHTIKLPEAVINFIELKYQDCLCRQCLQELADSVPGVTG